MFFNYAGNLVIFTSLVSLAVCEMQVSQETVSTLTSVTASNALERSATNSDKVSQGLSPTTVIPTKKKKAKSLLSDAALKLLKNRRRGGVGLFNGGDPSSTKNVSETGLKSYNNPISRNLRMRKPQTERQGSGKRENLFPSRKLRQSIIRSMLKKQKIREENMKQMHLRATARGKLNNDSETTGTLLQTLQTTTAMSAIDTEHHEIEVDYYDYGVIHLEKAQGADKGRALKVKNNTVVLRKTPKKSSHNAKNKKPSRARTVMGGAVDSEFKAKVSMAVSDEKFGVFSEANRLKAIGMQQEYNDYESMEEDYDDDDKDKEGREPSDYTSEEMTDLFIYQYSIVHDQEHYYRGPGNKCFTKEMMKAEMQKHTDQGTLTLVKKHAIERKRCWWITRTRCVQVSGGQNPDYRCVCKPGYTWEDGACLAYDGQPCRWSADCVANARCSRGSDAWNFDFMPARTTKKTSESVEVSQETENPKQYEKPDDQGSGEERSVEQSSEEMRRKKRNFNSTSNEEDEVEGEDQLQDESEEEPAGEVSESISREEAIENEEGLNVVEEDPTLKRRMSGASQMGGYSEELEEFNSALQSASEQRMLWGSDNVMLQAEFDMGVDYDFGFQYGHCECHPFLKCQRTVALPPFDKNEGDDDESSGTRMCAMPLTLTLGAITFYRF